MISSFILSLRRSKDGTEADAGKGAGSENGAGIGVGIGIYLQWYITSLSLR